MSKTEIAKLLAKQMAEREVNTITDDQEIESEMLNLFQATGKILEIVTLLQTKIEEQENQLNRLEKITGKRSGC